MRGYAQLLVWDVFRPTQWPGVPVLASREKTKKKKGRRGAEKKKKTATLGCNSTELRVNAAR